MQHIQTGMRRNGFQGNSKLHSDEKTRRCNTVQCCFSWVEFFSLSAEVFWESQGNYILVEMIPVAVRHTFINNCCLSSKLLHRNSPRSHIALPSFNVEVVLSTEKYLSIDKLNFCFRTGLFWIQDFNFFYRLERFEACMTKKKVLYGLILRIVSQFSLPWHLYGSFDMR